MIQKQNMLSTSPLLQYVKNESHKEQYKFLERNYDSDRYGISLCSLCIQPIEVNCITNNEVRKWLEWVNKNIVLHLGSDFHMTTMVKLRIATGMLNKLESLTSLEKIKIHDNLTLNIHREINVVLTEDLPF